MLSGEVATANEARIAAPEWRLKIEPRNVFRMRFMTVNFIVLFGEPSWTVTIGLAGQSFPRRGDTCHRQRLLSLMGAEGIPIFTDWKLEKRVEKTPVRTNFPTLYKPRQVLKELWKKPVKNTTFARAPTGQFDQIAGPVSSSPQTLHFRNTVHFA